MILFDFNKTTNKLLIKCEDISVLASIREHFSVEDKNASFIKRRYGRYNTKIKSRKYIITPQGACDIGLLWEIQNFLIEKQLNTRIKITDDLQIALNKGYNWEIFKQFNLELRDYQEDVVRIAIKRGWGTCVLGTGAGKTLTTTAIIENFLRHSNNREKFRCLLIVPDIGLVTQTYNECVEVGFTGSACKWTGNSPLERNTNLIICNMQILQSQFEQNEWVKYVDLLIVDECHKIKPGNKISKIISQIKTRNRFGFTGTLPQDDYDRWFILGKLGPVLYEKTSFDLRRDNYLTNVEVKVLRLNYKEYNKKQNVANEYREELEFIYNSEKRNNLLVKVCEKLNNNTLILVNHIAHGKNLLDELSKLAPGKQVFFIRGEIKVEERENIKRLMETKTNIICIAISSIFSTGVNIKNIHYIIFASGGKSFIRTVQSIGRGLRLHENKNKLIIFDMTDNLHYSVKHSIERKKIYEKEKINFTEAIVNIS